MKRWHFKYAHEGAIRSFWSDAFDASNHENQMSALRKCLRTLRQQFHLTTHEILDSTCQVVDDPGQN